MHMFSEEHTDLEIIGIRYQFSRVNYFDDSLWLKDGNESRHFAITTIPGLPYLRNPFSAKGTAILKPGKYKYRLGLHKGKYPALVQAETVVVWRDIDKDSVISKDHEEIGFFGINIHHAGFFSQLVGLSSAGCQVFQKRADFDYFIQYCIDFHARTGKDFIYNLIESP